MATQSLIKGKWQQTFNSFILDGGEGHPEAKFVRPTFLVNSGGGGADFENACYTGVQGAFARNLGLGPRFLKI